MGRQVYYYQGNQNALTAEQVAYYAYQAGFRGDDLVNMVAIAKRESGYKPNVHGSDMPQSSYSGDRGLWQINAVNDKTLVAAGVLPSERSPQIFDPLTNARAAYVLFQRSNGLSPWGVGPGGWVQGGDPFYGTNVNAAREAVNRAAAQGLFGPDAKVPTGLWDTITDLPGDVVGQVGDIAGNLNPIGPAKDAAGALADAAQALWRAGKWISDPKNLIRILQVLGGVWLLGAGLLVIAKADQVAYGTAMAYATKGAKV